MTDFISLAFAFLFGDDALSTALDTHSSAQIHQFPLAETIGEQRMDVEK